MFYKRRKKKGKPGSGEVCVYPTILSSASGSERLIVYFSEICVNEIFRLGKEYDFPRPEKCLVAGCGSSRIWGHGFVLRYLDCFDLPLWFKRWRCPECGCIYTTRPAEYWPRHHLPVKTIVSRLSHRITHGFWDKTLALTRQRQGHWLRALMKNIAMTLGVDKTGDLLSGLNELLSRQLIPVLRWSG